MENEVRTEEWYKSIIKSLRKEISELIKENSNLRERVIDLEMINQSHQELVGNLMEQKTKK